MIRKVIGIIIGASPFVIFGAAIYTNFTLLQGAYSWLGYVLISVGTLIAVSNFYLSFLRIPIHRMIYPHRPDPGFVSGLPLVGVFSLLGLVFVEVSAVIAVVVLVSLLIDTGGVQWLIVNTWKDESFWQGN